METAMVLNPNN